MKNLVIATALLAGAVVIAVLAPAPAISPCDTLSHGDIVRLLNCR